MQVTTPSAAPARLSISLSLLFDSSLSLSFLESAAKGIVLLLLAGLVLRRQGPLALPSKLTCLPWRSARLPRPWGFNPLNCADRRAQNASEPLR